ncbi:MAG: glutamine synthetase family protein [Oscillospiraceae bacterium]|jgi:glutamine synthetase|nr:glutamine synthetase family protein [Oscillospiraceae bacterium]
MRYTPDDILAFVRENDVRFVRLQFTDILGTIKNVAIPAAGLPRVLAEGCAFDGSSIEGFVRIEESDMLLRPDLDTFLIYPWRNQDGGQVARLICDVTTMDGEPFAGDPRTCLKQAVAEAANMGLTLDVGPELEFFLFHVDGNGRPTTHSHDTGGYFDLGPVDRGEDCRRDICHTLENMGFAVEGSHHEVAPAQHEIDFRHGEALVTADNVMTFKLVVKSVAQQHGLHATFMPKPVYDISGSGMHINLSLRRGEDNVFHDESDALGLSREAYSFMAGLLEHIEPMTLLLNPLVNSYKRLAGGYEAPVHIAWSAGNRSPLIRVPRSSGKNTRLELRSPDPACNPYLAFAACLRAGLDGMTRGLPAPAPVNENIFALSKSRRAKDGIARLPVSLQEAMRLYSASEFLPGVLGEHIFSKYLAAKKEEWRQYSSRVSAWELEQYLGRY